MTRGGHIEERHSVSYAVISGEGVIDSGGDVDAAVFGRSSTKPIQALALVASGAADAFELSDRHIALACASHNGEVEHFELATQWLERIGCTAANLECGVMRPLNAERDLQLAGDGVDPTTAHHMCSGKHSGFLTIARHLGVDPSGYIQPSHPVQILVSDTIALATGSDLASRPLGADGCGVPTHGTSLAELATAMFGISTPSELPDSLSGAGERIATAMMTHPYLVAGRGRMCTQLMEALPGQLAAKTGASGVFVVAARPPGGPNFGLALKVGDGAGVAAEAAVLELLKRQGIDAVAADPTLGDRLVLKNVAGTEVGSIEIGN